MSEISSVIVIGPFPPPLHGQALTNRSVAEGIVERGVGCVIINTAPPSLKKSIWARLQRLPRLVIGLVKYAKALSESPRAVYLSVSGGYGQVYEVIFILAARIFRVDIFIRHCCFSYLDSRRFIASVLVFIAGSDAVHVTQCGAMSAALKRFYRAKKVIDVSNAALVPLSAHHRPVRSALSLGLLSNLQPDKGVFEFLEIFKRLQARGHSVAAHLAGPIQDEVVLDAVTELADASDDFTYWGGIYDEERKDEFFAAIDLFVFLTTYKNETEAKVNLESMAHGVPVISTDIGCISSVIGLGGGHVVASGGEEGVDAVVDLVEMYCSGEHCLERASKSANSRFEVLRAGSVDAWKEFWHLLLRD